jgi:hypothetical protein
MSSANAPNPFGFTDALVAELQRKMRAALDGQSYSCLLTWACALLAVPLPPDGEVYPERPSVSSAAMLLEMEEQSERDDPRWGFLVITIGGEAFFLTPAHLPALTAAGMLLYGQTKWSAQLGFCSSPAQNRPLSDLAVSLISAPAWPSPEEYHYQVGERLSAKRCHQDIVLLSARRPHGFPL